MCDTSWSSRRKEVASLEKSWREFEEFVQWIKQRWSRPRAPGAVAPVTESPEKPQPATG